MDKNNRTCKMCSKKYSYCYTCPSDDNRPTWMVMFHNENCKNMFELVSNYITGNFTKEKAYEEISKLDLSDKSKYNLKTQKIIKEILSVHEVATETDENESQPKKMVYRKRKNVKEQ